MSRCLLRLVKTGLVVVAVAAPMSLCSTARAAAPSVTDVVFAVEGLSDGNLMLYPYSGTTSECSGFHRLRLTTAEGKTAGVGEVCFNQIGFIPYTDYYSWALALHLHGGRLNVSSSDNCYSYYEFGFPGPGLFGISCSAPVRSATGLFAGRPAQVTFFYRQLIDIYTQVTTWSPPPAIAIDFT